jgi:hypothetical protein
MQNPLHFIGYGGPASCTATHLTADLAKSAGLGWDYRMEEEKWATLHPSPSPHFSSIRQLWIMRQSITNL